ncbi:MAG: AraC family transcriptional regulator, partial [Puniceicoccales bacterium]
MKNLKSEPGSRSSSKKVENSAKDLLRPVRKMTRDMEPPISLFNGLRIHQSPAPDNIIFFQRTDVAAFRPEGVSHNFHHRFELVCALEGSGPARIGEQTHQFEPGDCALVFPNQFHHYIDVAAKKLDWLFITFEMSQSDSLSPLMNSPRLLNPTSIQLLQETLLPYCHRKKQEPNALDTAYHLSRFLHYMVTLPQIPKKRLNLATPDHGRDAILEQINNYVRDHLSEAPTISDLAQGLGYSVSHLRSVFHNRLGVSLGRYMRESRLSEAAKLLQESDLNVTEVAKRTGFDSLFAFSRAFKNTYGIAPKAYSQKVGTGHTK